MPLAHGPCSAKTHHMPAWLAVKINDQCRHLDHRRLAFTTLEPVLIDTRFAAPEPSQIPCYEILGSRTSGTDDTKHHAAVRRFAKGFHNVCHKNEIGTYSAIRQACDWSRLENSGQLNVMSSANDKGDCRNFSAASSREQVWRPMVSIRQ